MRLKRVSVRLSEYVAPKRYSIILFPNLSKFTFDGEVEISLDLIKPTKEITLHAAELKITSAVLKYGSFEVESQSISYNGKLETATMLFEKTIQVKEVKLKLRFTGVLNDKMRGFYRSKYKHNGEDYYMAVSQFESTDARRAFPSFDEPAKKAIFDVKLIIPQDHVAISNTVETEITKHSPGYKTVTFESTPKMSTYLLAFIVGRFEYIEAKTKSGIMVRVFTTPGKKHQGKFALNAAVQFLEFYEDYFRIPYSLPSLDLIAIPDFAAGAMENWGAVTYRETALLIDEDLSATVNKQHVAYVIAHELAHMWFGNLVTMEWWTHLWLNEGFATYIGYLAIDNVFPEWKIWTQFVYSDHAQALVLDGLNSTHAVEVDVHHPSEIGQLFDAISYEKGASVIRMLAAYMGEKAFQKGLQLYLEKYQYSNASTEDLWRVLGRVSEKNVKKIMENWTSKPGYPLVTVLDFNKKLKLTQERYFSSPLSAKKIGPSADGKTLWPIPLDSFLFSEKSFFIPKPKGYIKLNKGETSFIRIQYSPSLLKLLEEPIRNKRLIPEDRFGLIRDAFMLSQSGQSSTVDALTLTEAYRQEDSFVVWAEIASDLKIINNLIAGQSFHDQYKAFCRSIFKSIVTKMGWNKEPYESHLQTLLRGVALYAYGTNGDKDTIQKAKCAFGEIITGQSKIDPDLRGVVYNLVAENGGEEEYSKLKDFYVANSFQEEKDRISRALCSFRDIKLLKQTLDMSFSDQMKAQDRFKAIDFVWSNPVGQDLAWDYVRENWKSITKIFAGGHLYSRFIKPAIYFVDDKKAKEIEDFFKKNPSPGLERTIAQVTEQIRANSLWLARDKDSILSFLRRFRSC